ncbi:hypothetical protein G9A89_022557 [Geosiphon pyriformis]|nr:hypothetical protein G9A89_022557 [Geosiphon pyriformis]
MSKHVHDTNTRLDLKYPRKNAIKLESHLHICINLKIVLEIPATTMIQLVSRSSLVKKGINIKEEIIDAEYVENIIVMLQNDSKKAYIIEPNEKIAQAIFLPLVKVVQYLTIEVKKQPPNPIPNFLQLCRYVNITLQTIYGQEEYYLF